MNKRLLGCLIACLPLPVLAAAFDDFVSWALRPDGRAAVYMVKRAAAGPARLLHHDLQTGEVTPLAIEMPGGFQPRDARPTWSPDGSQVAYFLPVNGSWRLHVWRASDGTRRAFEQREMCVSANGCSYNRPQWSSDSRSVYVLARPQDGSQQRSPGSAASPANGEIPAWRALMFSGPESGVTVLEAEAPTQEQASQPTLLPAGIRADIVVADTRSGDLTPVATGKNFARLAIAPDGKRLLAIAWVGIDGVVRQEYSDYYVLPLGNRSRKTAGVEPLLRQVQQRWPAAWSPDSKSIAFVENGALAPGDIFLLDVASGRARNLTQSLVLTEAGEQRELMGLAARNRDTPGDKFGGTPGIVWSATGDALYVLRRTRFESNWKTRLWKITTDGKATNLSVGAAFDAALPLRPVDDTNLLVPIRFMSGDAGFATISAGGRMQVRTRIDGDFQSTWHGNFSETDGGASLFISESPSIPPEGFVVRRDDASVTRVTRLNAAAAEQNRPAEVQRISWQPPSGEPRFGYVYRKQKDSHLPMVVQIYPSDPFDPPDSGSRYAGRSDLFMTPPLADLLDSGYAIFVPDLLVTGKGKACDDVAANLELALDAVDKAGLADTRRAALFGFSFGGWAVNCAITRTGRFRAAVSVAGPSDLFSTRFMEPVWGVSGGQTRIGTDVWDSPDLYWRESPVSGAPNVTTPLLLVHGKLDMSVPVFQAAEMYTALSRFGKTVSLVVYHDATHVNVDLHPDYSSRIKRWIDNYLRTPLASEAP